MQDRGDVIDYSKNLQKAIRDVSKTRKDLATMIDPEVAAAKHATLSKQLYALE